MMKEHATKLRFGILGMSPGNGHPYSWSAICNGYDAETMASCPFPVIPRYLAERSFPADALADAEVTHIWTQDRALSEHVARASCIGRVVDRPEDMIGEVDAILLARDDYENHEAMSRPFLESGLPVFVDKPLAVDRATAERIWAMQTYPGQLFTGTSFRYAREFALTEEDRRELGELVFVDACVMNGWDKYGIHVVEPVLHLIGDQGAPVDVAVRRGRGSTTLHVQWETGLRASFTSLGGAAAPVAIRLFGTNGYRELKLGDTYSAFKASLQAFADVIRGRLEPVRREDVMRVVDLLERGLAPVASAGAPVKEVIA